VDLVSDDCVWELKCTSDISIDHRLQVVIYAWLWHLTGRPEREFRILNILTGEIVVLGNHFDDINTVVIELLKGKYDDLKIKSDEEFVESCVGSRDE
jgi:hypothetical protein